jgi:hypothetical protein
MRLVESLAVALIKAASTFDSRPIHAAGCQCAWTCGHPACTLNLSFLLNHVSLLVGPVVNFFAGQLRHFLMHAVVPKLAALVPNYSAGLLAVRSHQVSASTKATCTSGSESHVSCQAAVEQHCQA